MEKIELTPTKRVKDHTTVWQTPDAQVDIAMDLKALSFRPGSLTQICSFHVVDHFFPEEIPVALKNWYECLAPGGLLYVVVDDFEYTARAMVGGDISIEVFNREHNHPTQFSQSHLAKKLKEAGFTEDNISIWFQDVPGLFTKEHFELVLMATK